MKKTGVYIFKDKLGTFLYIGKSSDLDKRIKSHFTQPTYKDRLFRDKVRKISKIETGSEIEALILESRLIKKHRPKYNYIWKDDKNYFHIAVTKEKLPRIFLTHQAKTQANDKKIDFIGPFVDGKALKQTLSVLRKTFPYYVQSGHPRNKCPWCHLELCPGPDPDIKKYGRDISSLKMILRGKKNSVLKKLKNEMKEASKKENYETAAQIRNKISALEKILHNSKVISGGAEIFSRAEGYDISNIQGKFAVGSMVVFENGRPNKSAYRKFKIKMKNEPNDTAMIREVILRRFNHSEWQFPDIILIDGGKGQLNAAKSGYMASQTFSVKSRDPKIMALAKKNNQLFIDGKEKPSLLDKMPVDFANFILRLRDEAHRFAVTYHKKLRQSDLLK